MARKTALKILNKSLDISHPDRNWIKEIIENSHLERSDRKLVWELVNGVLKNMSLLDNFLKRYYKNVPSLNINNILRMGIYQFLFTRIPQYAIIDESVKLSKTNKSGHSSGFINGVLRNIQRDLGKLSQEISDPKFPKSMLYSIPKWLEKTLFETYGSDKTYEMFNIIALPPLLPVRIRENVISINDFKNKLQKEEIEYDLIDDGPWCLIIDKEKFWKSDNIKLGLCHVQDFSSGVPVRLFDFNIVDEPHVLDMCSAPGGKALQLLDLMKGRGSVLANDINKNRLPLLKENLERSAFDNYEISNKDALSLDGKYSHILIDAPCTGLGTLRKRADLRWNKTPEEIIKMHSLQISLLEKAASLIEKEGEIVYSTCSIVPGENEEVISEFLETNTSFSVARKFEESLAKYKTDLNAALLLPAEKFDGAYSVKLIKS